MDTIYTSSTIRIWQIPSGPYATNCYLLACEKNAYVIDPAPDSAALVTKVVEDEKFNLQGIFLTHSHWDHIADVAQLMKRYPGIFLRVHEADRAK